MAAREQFLLDSRALGDRAESPTLKAIELTGPGLWPGFKTRDQQGRIDHAEPFAYLSSAV